MTRTAGIISTLNQEKYIHDSISSLAPQVDELIVVNDGSSDSTSKIISGLPFENIVYIEHKSPQGVSQSYNEAVSASSADYIFIQGGDDISEPWRVQHQLESLREKKVVFSYSEPRIINSDGRLLPDDFAPEFFEENIENFSPISRLFFQGNFICAPTVGLRKEDFIRCGGFLESSIHLQDWYLWMLLLNEGEAYKESVKLTEYRKHSNNLSREKQFRSNPNISRINAEKNHVLSKVVLNLSRNNLEILSQHIGVSNSVIEKLDNNDLVALIRLAHNDQEQNRQGLEHLFSLIDSQEGREKTTFLGIDDLKLNYYSDICFLD